MQEKTIERQLAKAVKEMGGLSPKWVSPGLDGVPDRIILLPNGAIAFAEVKITGGKLRPVQQKRKQQLEALGFRVYIIDSVERIREVLNEIQST